jgi:heat shock protein HtpX
MASRRARRELFAPDRGLQVRMVLVAVLTPVIVLGALAALFLLAPGRLDVGLGIALAVGIASVVRSERPEATPIGPGEEPELEAIVQRLCARIDLPVPEIVVEPERQPNSWVVGARRRRSRLHVTRGLLNLLERDELEAVIAHELAHVAHRDAAVMTVVGGPGEALRNGGRRAGRGWGFVWIGALAAAALGEVSTIGTRSLSRHRELAADRTAASLTGRPSALVSALHKISGRMELIPRQDLRLAAGRDAFNLVPTGEPLTGLRARFMDTHPPLEVRIARLERLEHRLHAPGG